MIIRCQSCDFETDVVYDAACHFYALGGDHHTTVVVPAKVRHHCPKPVPDICDGGDACWDICFALGAWETPDEPCPEDPDGLHFVGCGCDA